MSSCGFGDNGLEAIYSSTQTRETSLVANSNGHQSANTKLKLTPAMKQNFDHAQEHKNDPCMSYF